MKEVHKNMKKKSASKKNVMAEARNIFLAEIKQKLPECQAALATLQREGYSKEMCKIIYKFGHTLKGSGHMVGLLDIAEPAGEMAIAALLVQEYDVSCEGGLIRFLNERLEEIKETVGEYQEEQFKSSQQEKNIPKAKGKKILVVDDDPTVTGLVKEGLEEEGFKVAIANNTIEAEKYLELEQPDLIVLDIIMPLGEDGIEFCLKIRASQDLQVVPIIFLTKKVKLKDKLEGFATGADDYLCKPFRIEELLARIYAILNRVQVYHELVLRDELTKAYNRRFMQRRMLEEISRAKRSREKFSVAMIDIDYFKDINDNYGHVVGDQVLKELVNQLIENLRSSDVTCRFGGEEFVVILPDTANEEAHAVLERIRQIVASNPYNITDEGSISITISVGIATFPDDGSTWEELISSADKAMYRAKETGRNKVLMCERG